MRFMMMVRATKETESGAMPSQEMINAMMSYNEALMQAGVLLDGGGLQPSAAGFRVAWNSGKKSVVDGPFAETKELIAGYWIIQVKSKEEAVEWAMRCPNPYEGADGAIELRPLFESPDLTDDEEIIRKENEMMAQLEKNKKS
ncbi:MAG TPA: YciI family protein [Symbiobacteriaceae bacterium]|jgi:hypothetical protein|nr:YciI family protein [Symbiobacteriaceae bacterium]